MDPLYKIQRFFQSFNAYVTNVEVEQQISPLYSYHTALKVYEGYKITMTTVFHSHGGITELMNFADRVEKEEDEARLRERNPTLKRAYEEYQILLKLIK